MPFFWKRNVRKKDEKEYGKQVFICFMIGTRVTESGYTIIIAPVS